MDSNKGPTSANALDCCYRLHRASCRANWKRISYIGASQNTTIRCHQAYRQYMLGDDAEVSLSHIQKRNRRGGQAIYESNRRVTDPLAELQHLEARFLIDFTSDFLIALFFACDGVPMEEWPAYSIG